jgi:hypothetical protein
MPVAVRKSIGIGLAANELPPNPGFPALDTIPKKFNSRLVAPTVLQTQIPSLVAKATGDGIRTFRV